MEQDYKLTINMDSGESYYIWKPNKEDIGKIIYEIMMQEDFIVVNKKVVICSHISSFEISDVRYLDERYDDRIHPIESDYKDVALLTMIKVCITAYKEIKEEKDKKEVKKSEVQE
jgi:DNA-binding cell septation regulator SpoVG